MFYYLYKITNWYNGKIYVGYHQTENLNDGYFGSGTYLKRAIKKYGLEYFSKDILQFFDSPEEMKNAESVLVNEEFIQDQMTYNIKLGGEGGWDYVNNNYSEELRYENAMKWNFSHRYRYLNDFIYKEKCNKIISETIKKNHKLGKLNGSSRFSGKHHSEEAKRNMGILNSIHQSGSGNSNFGKCWIYNLELQESKSIPKDELDFYLEQGWIKGRKIKF